MVPPEEIDATATATAVSDPDETSPASAEDSHDPEHGEDGREREPSRLGRYVLLREIGAGAIGIVYAAYHEGLDRKLAIKVLNRQRAGRADLEARLRREAKALAKLSHPNVVQVYDVGELEGRVFVAMEFVEGETLGEWMRREHDVDELVAMFVAAGRGLAAAHRAGVIHRDFKPDNVLVGSDGRPRVLDFGLAQAVERSALVEPIEPREQARAGPLASLAQLLHTGPTASRGRATTTRERQRLRAVPEPEPDAPAANLATGDGPRPELEIEIEIDENGEDPHVRATQLDHDPEFVATLLSEPGPDEVLPDDGVMTRDGALLGTPAYMSPEQFLGRRVDRASDQFSFCVALYEALYGHRPFVGKTAIELALQTQSGSVVDAPPNAEVPARLRQILLRGLSPRPEHRFESMDALIDALEHDPGVRRRRRLIAGLGITAGIVLAFVIGALAPKRDSPCPETEALADELWPEARARALADRFTGSPLPYADAAWSTVEAQLGTWSRRWAERRVEACEATHLRHEFSTEAFDLRQACLARGRRAFDALTEQLASAEAEVIERAVEATAALPDPARCLDAGALLVDLEPPPEAVVDEVEELREQLAELETLVHTGRWQRGLPRAAAAVERARETEYGPVIAEALLVRGRLLAAARAGGEARDALQSALDEAERHAHDELVPRVATELVSLSIYTRPDPVRGRLWAQRALTALDRVDEQGHARARGIWALGNIERLDGANARAEAKLRRALELLDEHAPEHPDRAIMLNDLGNALEAQGRFDEARSVYEQALAQSELSFGAGHPRVGHARYNLARLAFAEGRLAEARAQLDHAHRIYVEALGRRHRDVGSAELLATNIALAEGEVDEAATHAQRVKAIYDAELAPDNVDRAEPDLLLGHVAFTRGRLDQALLHYRTCLAIQRAALPPGHIDMALTLGNLGLVHLARGDLDPAVEQLAESLALLEAGESVNPEELRTRRLYLGDALLARADAGDHRRAAAAFEAAFEGCVEPLTCATLALRAARAHAGRGDNEAAGHWAAVARPLYERLDPVEHEQRDAALAEIAQLDGR